jgi:hypothetical protein
VGVVVDRFGQARCEGAGGARRRAARAVAAAVATAIGAALGTLTLACAPGSGAEWVRGKAAGGVLAQRVRDTTATGAQPVRLGDLVPFRFDRLYVFGPYTPARVVRDSLRIAWPGAAASQIESSDGANLLVFVGGGQVIAAVMQPRELGDFADEARGRGYTPEEANFAVTTAPNGRRVLRPAAGR